MSCTFIRSLNPHNPTRCLLLSPSTPHFSLKFNNATKHYHLINNQQIYKRVAPSIYMKQIRSLKRICPNMESLDLWLPNHVPRHPRVLQQTHRDTMIFFFWFVFFRKTQWCSAVECCAKHQCETRLHYSPCSDILSLQSWVFSSYCDKRQVL